MFTAIRAHMLARRERHAARDRYLDHADLVGSLLWVFDYSDRAERISNLSVLVLSMGQMARECLIFDDGRSDREGYSPYEWHMNGACLFLLVLAAEENDYSQLEDDEVAANLFRDPEVQRLLGMLNDLGDEMRPKADVLLALCDTVAPDVGGQAAEGLVALAYMYCTSAGLTNKEAEKIAWEAVPHT